MHEDGRLSSETYVMQSKICVFFTQHPTETSSFIDCDFCCFVNFFQLFIVYCFPLEASAQSCSLKGFFHEKLNSNQLQCLINSYHWHLSNFQHLLYCEVIGVIELNFAIKCGEMSKHFYTAFSTVSSETSMNHVNRIRYG